MQTMISDSFSIAAPIERGKVAVFPILTTNDSKTRQDIVTLAEAKKNGWIEITEAEVETVEFLLVKNTGNKPILLLAGELLLGGKQDRVVRSDTIVDPGESVKVPVYCVEAGRWTPDKHKFESAFSQVPTSVKTRALYGNQQEVWDSVSEFNQKAGYSGDKTTVSAGLSETKELQDFSKYVQEIEDELGKNERVVGAVFAINGEIHSMELFGHHILFKTSLNSLLNGYFSEASYSDAEPRGDSDIEEAAEFAREVVSGKRETVRRDGRREEIQLGNTLFQGREVTSEPSDSEDRPFDNLIHGTYTKKE